MSRGLVAQQFHDVWKKPLDRFEAVLNAAGAPWKVRHKGTAPRPGKSSRQHCGRSLGQPLSSNGIGQPGRLLIQYTSCGLRRHVTRGKARTPGGQYDVDIP